MLELHDARPDAQRDLVLRTSVNQRLIESLTYLLDICSRRQGVRVESAGEQLATFTATSKLSGMVHVVHDRLVAAIKANDAASIQTVLDAFATLTYASQDARVIGLLRDGYSMALHRLYLEASDAGTRRTYKFAFDGTPANDDEYNQASVATERAVQRLMTVDPDLFDEFNTLVSDVMILHSPTMNAATSVSSLGIIRMSQLRPTQTWSRYLETLAHEAAHHHLNYLWFGDPIILNEEAGPFSSPLRQEKRPLSGIYHAMFVLGRTMRAINALQTSPTYDPEQDRIQTAYNNAGNSASFEQKFLDCWNVLTEHAKLTELGRRLMLSTREMALG